MRRLNIGCAGRQGLRTLAAACALAALALVVAAAPAGAKTKTKTFQNPTVIPIPDAINTGLPDSQSGQAISDVPIDKKGTVKDINVGIQITHTFTSDLQIYLQKGTTYIPLANADSGPGTNNNDFGGGTGCAGGMTVFDGDATLSIDNGQNPYAGSFLPTDDELPLRLFNGQQVRGVWRLIVLDRAAIDTGTINCFQVTAKYKTG